MKRKIMLLLAVMVIFTIPAYSQMISGTVHVNGSAPSTTAWIGVKTTTNAMADANAGYVSADASGVYSTGSLTPQDYYVGVWVDGYKTEEQFVTVPASGTVDVSFNLTAAQITNAAMGRSAIGGCYRDDGVFVSAGSPGQQYGGNGTFLDGTRNNGYSDAGDARVPTGGGVTPMYMGADLSNDKEVSEVLIDWYYDGAWYWPRGGYKVQYATAAAPTTWNDFYVYNPGGMPSPRPYSFGASMDYEVITGAPAVGRYWRIWANDGYGWNKAIFLVQEFEVYSSTPDGPPPTGLLGTVSVNGTPRANAAVGIKSTTAATADAPMYRTTNGTGQFDVSPIANGSYYVGVWVDGYRMVETPVTITGGSGTVDINLTQVQFPNVASHKTCIGGAWYPDDVFYGINVDQPEGYNHPGSGGALVDGSRDSAYVIAGDLRASPTPPYFVGVDCGVDVDANQVLIDFYGSPFFPYGYKVEYATNAAPATWHTWYQLAGPATPTPYGDSQIEAIYGQAATGRYWRISATATDLAAWGSPAFLVQEFEIYSTTPTLPGPLRINGIVQVNGVPQANAVVGVKTAPSATADADHYYMTNSSGYFETGVLTEGTWYVGAWVSGYKESEVSVSVSATAGISQNFNLTEVQEPDAAAGETAIGGVHLADGAFVSAGNPGQPNGGNGTFLDGYRDNAYTVCGDQRVGNNVWTPEAPIFAGVDLVSDKEVSQVLVDFFGGGYEPVGYKIQYATSAAPTVWHDFYSWNMDGVTEPTKRPQYFGSGCYNVISGAPSSGRFWRVYAEKGSTTGWGFQGFLLQEFEVYSSTPTPPTKIVGTITTNGAPRANAVVGVKTTPSATADANYYGSTGVDGAYSIDVPPGSYYVGVWADGWKMAETSTSLDVGVIRNVSFDLTEAQDTNAAKGFPGIGGAWYADEIFYGINDDQPEGYNHPGSGGALTNGVRDGNYIIAGDFRTTPEPPYFVGVDLGIDKEVSQALIDWFSDGYMPIGYKVQYATEADPTTWNDWYTWSGAPKGFGAGVYDAISAPPGTGRYWRIAAQSALGWQNNAQFVLQEFEVYSSTPSPGISRFKGLPDGTTVGIYAKPVTLTPMLGGGPTGDFFYIEEPDRTAAIRVVDNTYTGNPLPVPGDVVSVTGTIETDDGYGGTFERFISAESIMISSANFNVGPLGVNTRAIDTDTKLAGMLVRTSGLIRELDSDGNYQWFKISDGYGKGGSDIWTKVAIAGYYGDPSLGGKIAMGDYVKVTGTVSQEDAGTKLILLRSISFAGPALPSPANSMTIDFENYSIGDIAGQDGWAIYSSFAPGWAQTGQVGTSTAQIAASPSSMGGTKSLKLTAPSSVDDPNPLNPTHVISDSIAVHKTVTAGPLATLVLKFDVWREGGTVDLPANGYDPSFPAGTFPKARTNNFSWWSPEHTDATGGSDGLCGEQQDVGNVTWPFAWATGSTAATTLGGSFAKVVEWFDFTNGVAWTWYNGELLDDGITITPTSANWSDLVFHYQQTQPFVAGTFGYPCYIDNIQVAWE